MYGNEKENEEIRSLADEVTTDLEGFLEAEQEPDCEERTYTIHGAEVTEGGTAK